MVGKRNPTTLRMEWAADPGRKVPVGFFVRGHSYRLFGVMPANVHLMGATNLAAGRAYLLGTDRLGRDQWSRLMHGTQTSMTIGLVAVTLSVLLGVVLGGVSGYFGGLADAIIQRLIELLQSLPTIPIWLALTAALPRDWTPQQVFLAITVFITHDLGVIAQIAHHVVVMYLGRVMEQGPVDDIFHAPKHPYTRALLRSIPSLRSPARVKLPIISGSLPHPFNRPSGCPFHPRCADAVPGVCGRRVPSLQPVGERQSASCFLYHDVAEPHDVPQHHRADERRHGEKTS